MAECSIVKVIASVIFLQEASVLGSFFFLLYVAVVFFGLMSMFVTIICEAFALIKEDTGAAKNDYEVSY